MNDERPRRSVEDILTSFGQTSYGHLLHDDVQRRHVLATLMADSADPIVREMGRQLRDGQATLGQLLAVPDYAEALGAGAERLGRLDLDELGEQVDEVRDRERDEVPDRELDEARARRLDEPDRRHR